VILALFVMIIGLGLAAIVWTGLSDRWTRDAVVKQIEQATGGRVELKAFRLHWMSLRAEIEQLTVHGTEPEGTPPLFHVERMVVDLRVVSFFGRKIALDELKMDRPEVFVRIDADGRTNFPGPKVQRAPGKPWQERVFDLTARQLRLSDGSIAFNDVRVPLAVEGGAFSFAVDFHAPAPGREFYTGQMSCQGMKIAARRYQPFQSDLHAKFTLERDAFLLEQLLWILPGSNLDATARVSGFADPKWNFRYRGRLALDDLRTILRKPTAPSGRVDFTGEGTYANRKVSVAGRYSAQAIDTRWEWFDSADIAIRGSYRADNRALTVPDLELQLLGGRVQGQLNLVFDGLKFRVDSRARGMSLARLLDAVGHTGFPIESLHWNADVDVEAETTWSADFKTVESRGVMLWSPPVTPQASDVPAAARLPFDYSMVRRSVRIASGEISTPSSRLEINGTLGARDSSLEAMLAIDDLLPWNDFINQIRGAKAESQRVSGKAAWQGRVTGPLDAPAFSGRTKLAQFAYGRYNADELEGEMSYSPEAFRLMRTRMRRGSATAQVELALYFDNWSFCPACAWSLETTLERAPTDDLQALIGWNYPARGLLTGHFRAGGTRAAPELSGSFDLAQVEAWGISLESARGQLSLRQNEIRISNAELRAASRGNGGRPAGVITGNFEYHPVEQTVAFDLTGAVIPLEDITRIQSERLPLGGQLSFQVSGQGPLTAPIARGSLRLVNLRVGDEVLGSLESKLDSDGRRLQFEVGSAMTAGHLQGKLELGLGGDYPIRGDLNATHVDLAPFLRTALRLEALSGRSSVDGRFLLSGALRRPETLALDAELTRLTFGYRQVKLENVGPIRLTYRRDEVRIEQAALRGADTDFQIAGSARFTGDRRLNMNVAGTVNLQLADGFLPGVEARGPAQVNASIAGTLSSPRINGKVALKEASATYGEFPTGLSRITGEFNFDSSRLNFENVSAEAGGGRMLLSGTLAYGDGPLHYDLTARAYRVRVRYPVGMSWLAGGTLRMVGSTRAAVLSGQVVVERLLMTQGFDLASFFNASKDAASAPTTGSPFLRNLQFDIHAVSSPDSRLEWAGSRFDTEADLRVRGTWEHPILLGQIRLLSGEMNFRGSRYRLTRGEISFSNPFRLDPVLNLEAVTTVQQYEVTLAISGPASKLALSYRSDPPLPSGDVITLLALGRTGEESQLRSAAPGQTSELGAGTLISEAISSQLGGRLERLFGISRFRVDPFVPATSTDQNAGARITIEQQVRRNLVITYSTNVTSSQQQVIQVEYNVSRDISIVALRDQNGTFGIDVKFKKRFK